MKHAPLYILLAVVWLCPLAAGAQANGENALFQKATSYFFQKKFDLAESLLRQIIEKNPDNGLAYSYLGDILLVDRKYDDALVLYKKSVELRPNSGENYFRMGQIYYYKKNGDLSVDSFKKAIEVDNQLKFAYYHVGLAYLVLIRDKGNTIENWETYLRVAPDDPQYDRIKRAIELLRDPNFVIPPPGSDISIEEALLLGGSTIDKTVHKSTDQEEGHESKKTKRKLEDIYHDDDL